MSSLRRQLGLPSLLFNGLGVIVGAGIYSVIGAAAAVAQGALWLSFLLAAIPALLAALCYAEMSTMFPQAGAEYLYLKKAFPLTPSISFAVGFLVLLNGMTTAATVSVAFAGYLQTFVPVHSWVGALMLLAGCCGLNIVGIRESAWVTAIATIIEVGGLVMIIAAGLTRASPSAADWEVVSPGVFGGAALIFFVYTGFEGLVNLAEESKAPERDLPKALMISLVMATLLYVLVAVAVLSLVSPSELSASDSPLATAGHVAAPWLGTAVAWIALFSTGNTALITSIVVSRLLFSMARSGDLPGFLEATLPQRKSPWVAALVTLAGACLFVPLGSVAVIGAVSSLATLAAFVGVGVAVLTLRVRAPSHKRPFRIPMTIKSVPVVPVLLIASVLGLVTQFEWKVYLIGLIASGVGLLVYVLRRRSRKSLRPLRKGRTALAHH